MAMLNQDVYHIIYLRGPRGAGKTSCIKEVMRSLSYPSTYLSAEAHAAEANDILSRHDDSEGQWLVKVWTEIRKQIEQNPLIKKHVVFVDDVQSLKDFPRYIKPLWDQDRRFQYPIQVVLAGSTPFLIQKDISDSMVGRVVPIFMHHWSYQDMSQAFQMSLDDYLLYGGYPGSHVYFRSLAREDGRQEWSQWVKRTIIQPSLEKDILAHHPIKKPQLLRDAFRYGMSFSSQVVPLRRMMRGLDDVGNPQTLKRYLSYFAGPQLVVGLANYALDPSKHSSCHRKYLALNTALITALQIDRHQSTLESHSFRLQMIKSAVGAHLYNSQSDILSISLFYWRDTKKGYEVDYVFEDPSAGTMAAFHVLPSSAFQHKALKAFRKEYGVDPLILGEGGDVSLEEFFLSTPALWLREFRNS